MQIKGSGEGFHYRGGMSKSAHSSAPASHTSGGRERDRSSGRSARAGTLFGWLAAALGLGLLAVGAAQVAGGGEKQGKDPVIVLPPAAPRHPVHIHRPPGPRQVATGLTNFLGQPVLATCSSCHSTTRPNLETRRSEDLDQFHQGLNYAHGEMTCLSCHHAGDYESLRLADGRAVAFSDSMTLCSQCHGPQRRDYDRGLHGGMIGHWDLTRGERHRNTCVDCHDPHAPAFPTVLPVLPPRDRVSVPAPPSGASAHE